MKSKLAIILLVILTIISGYFYYDSKNMSKAKEVSLTSFGSLTALEKGNDKVMCIRDLMVEIKGSVLKARSIDGNIHWSQKQQAKIKEVFEAGTNIVILDEDNKVSCISPKGKLLWQSKYTASKLDIYTDINGFVLVEAAEVADKEETYFEVYDNKGIKAGRIPLDKASIMSFASNGEDAYIVSLVDISGDEIKSKLVNCNKKGEITWAVNYDNKIIPIVKYIDKNMLYAITEDSIYKYRSDGKLLKEEKLEGKPINFDAYADKVAITIKKSGKYRLNVYNSALTKTGDVQLQKHPNGIYLNNDIAAVYYDEELECFDKEGILKYNYKSPESISNIYMENSDIYIISKNKMELVKYK